MCIWNIVHAAQKHFKYSSKAKSTPVWNIIMPYFQDHETLILQIVGLSHSNTQFWKSTVFNRKRKLKKKSGKKLL